MITPSTSVTTIMARKRVNTIPRTLEIEVENEEEWEQEEKVNSDEAKSYDRDDSAKDERR